MNITYYNPSTGQITYTTTIIDSASFIPENDNYLEGRYSGNEYYVNLATKQPEAIPDKPVNALTQYIFDWATKSWIVDQAQTEFAIRARRNSLLNQTVDQINPVRYATLTTDQQAELATYRQALLDVPQQTGFPTNVEWPTKPSWL